MFKFYFCTSVVGKYTLESQENFEEFLNEVTSKSKHQILLLFNLNRNSIRYPKYKLKVTKELLGKATMTLWLR